MSKASSSTDDLRAVPGLAPTRLLASKWSVSMTPSNRLILVLSCYLSVVLAGCGGASQDAVAPIASPPPNGGAQVRAAGTYDTSSIRSDGVLSLDDGREAERFQNLDYACGQPDVPGNPATTGVHEFTLYYPVGYDRSHPRPFVLYAWLIGGDIGWIDVDGRYSGGKPGTYRGPAFVATAAYNRDRMLKFGQGENISELVSRMKAAHPEWAFLMPSYCSHDVYNGMGEGADFPRYGWLALVGAIKYVRDHFGITEMFAEGVSAGGSGSFFLARDLERVLPDVPLRGVVFNSEAHESALGPLYDDNQTLILPDPRGGTAVVPCEADFEPLKVGELRVTTEAGGLPFAAAEDILAGMVQVPIYHVWGRRESQFCQDEQYSDQFLHGPIARAIVAVNPAQRSWNRRVCEENPEWPLPCGKHGVLDGLPDLEAGDRNPDVAADVQAWVERLHSDYANALTHPQDH